MERRKLIVSLSTAALGVFFLNLTSQIPEPVLTPRQEMLVLVSLIGFSLAVLSGVLAWRADGGRFYFAAKCLEEVDEEQFLAYRRKEKGWKMARRLASRVLYLGFFIGIVAATLFTADRI